MDCPVVIVRHLSVILCYLSVFSHPCSFTDDSHLSNQGYLGYAGNFSTLLSPAARQLLQIPTLSLRQNEAWVLVVSSLPTVFSSIARAETDFKRWGSCQNQRILASNWFPNSETSFFDQNMPLDHYFTGRYERLGDKQNPSQGVWDTSSECPEPQKLTHSRSSLNTSPKTCTFSKPLIELF